MNVNSTMDSKDQIATDNTSKHGCCGGEAAAEAANDASKRVDREHADAPKVAKSSCCCVEVNAQTSTLMGAEA
jgi:hypothetical protein